MNVTEIQRFCMHDGPGLRTTVFLKGCPLHCRWCHNPETQYAGQQLLYYAGRCIGCGACAAVCPAGAHSSAEGVHRLDRSHCMGCLRCTAVCPAGALAPALREMTPEAIFEAVAQDRPFYGREGGLTLSGGEPMLQPDGVLALFRLCQESGIGTALETCGYFDPQWLPQLVPLTDVFLWDFKDGNDDRHRRYTGVSNERILRNLRLADERGAVTVLRCILVNGVNMQEDHYRAIAEVWHTLRHGRYVELLPYHAYGGAKRLPLGQPDDGRRDWIPTDDGLEQAKRFLLARDVRVK